MKIPAAGCDPTAVVFQGVPHIVYVDHNQRGREIWFDGQWRQHPLPAAPLPASEVAISKTNERLYVTYRTRFGNPCELTLNSSPLESKRIWTPRLIKRLPSQGRPIAFNLADRRYVIFRATEKWPVRQPFLFHHILRDLQVNGRMTNVELSKRAGISAPPCLRRVRALEEAGYITGYHAEIDGTMLDYKEMFFALVGLDSQAQNVLQDFMARYLAWSYKMTRVKMVDFDLLMVA